MSGDLIFESCNCTFVFDAAASRYRRILKVPSRSWRAATPWSPYYRLDIDDGSESFVVWLDSSGHRLLRSWRHRGHCSQCGGEPTSELSGDELRMVATGTGERPVRR